MKKRKNAFRLYNRERETLDRNKTKQHKNQQKPCGLKTPILSFGYITVLEMRIFFGTQRAIRYADLETDRETEVSRGIKQVAIHFLVFVWDGV